jgi:hypothetical protein
LRSGSFLTDISAFAFPFQHGLGTIVGCIFCLWGLFFCLELVEVATGQLAMMNRDISE